MGIKTNNGRGEVIAGKAATDSDKDGMPDFDLRTITRGFQEVKPSYTVSAAENGSVELRKDGYTARFTPDKNYKGLASFKYTVKGNDNTEYTGRVEVLVEKFVQDSIKLRSKMRAQSATHLKRTRIRSMT